MSIGIPQRENWTDLRTVVAAALAGVAGMLAVPLWKSLFLKMGVLAAALLISAGIFAFPHLGIALIMLTMPYMNVAPSMEGGALSSLQPSAILLPLTLLAAFARTLLTGRYKIAWTALSTPLQCLGRPWLCWSDSGRCSSTRAASCN